MTFYSKEINQAVESLSQKEIEYLARIKIQEFIRQGYSPNAIKDEIKELIGIEQSNHNHKGSEPLFVGNERNFH